MKVIKAPEKPIQGKISVFLGGSIEMGAAEEWQSKLTDFLASQEYQNDLVLYNPRRDDWNASWPNTADFAPFKEQVNWELDRQEASDLIVYWFAAETLSPITLLELGLFHTGNIVVGIDPAYKRAGNVEIVLQRYNVGYAKGWDAFCKCVDVSIRSVDYFKSLI